MSYYRVHIVGLLVKKKKVPFLSLVSWPITVTNYRVLYLCHRRHHHQQQQQQQKDRMIVL